MYIKVNKALCFYHLCLINKWTVLNSITSPFFNTLCSLKTLSCSRWGWYFSGFMCFSWCYVAQESSVKSCHVQTLTPVCRVMSIQQISCVLLLQPHSKVMTVSCRETDPLQKKTALRESAETSNGKTTTELRPLALLTAAESAVWTYKRTIPAAGRQWRRPSIASSSSSSWGDQRSSKVRCVI